MTDDASAADADADSLDGDGLDAADQRTAVRERYARIATEESSCCDTDCCESDDTDSDPDDATDRAHRRGYSDADLDAVDAGADASLGCGNPTAIADLEEGDTVLDLGSGGGFDCFLAAREVGSAGRVVGVDMTPEMVEKARENAETNDASNVEFRLGEIEHLPVADASVDVILSNCVVNLSPDKRRVFREAYRVLRPGGRLAVSDVVLTADLPADLRADPASVAACVGGASPISALEAMLTDAGFADVSIEPKAESEEFVREWDDEHDLSDYLVAATIEGKKPASESDSSRGGRSA
ncbi:arsenite methyltransferase [Halorussus limi]|uniref:Arsenite methyltransferase n=1 Tax=Halorussus limi TaxID=2938695 RepID=A0A8U0HQD7_9EURY|nr:arsenite methyltransferase [Halorussus limi]UPV73081.1 arsenite methyltransferase [Halorussus limi]